MVIDKGSGLNRKEALRLTKLLNNIDKNLKFPVTKHYIALELLMSKLLVKKFNGVLKFKTKMNHGSTFYVTFDLEELKVESHLNQFQNISSSPPDFQKQDRILVTLSSKKSFDDTE